MLVPTCTIKFIELVLAATCLTLHHYSYDMTDIPTLILCSGTYIGYVVVLSGELIGEIVSAAPDPFVDAWWSGTGGVMFGACGWLTLSGWRDVPASMRRSYGHAAGVCAIATAALLALDALVALCSVNSEVETPSRKGKPCNTCA